MDENNNRNFLLAIGLSMLVLFGWQMFYAGPKLRQEKQRQEQIAAQKQDQQAASTQAGTVPGQPGGNGSIPLAEALTSGPRVAIDTPQLEGSIGLEGGRIDYVVLKSYRETIDPGSPHVVLFTPAGTRNAYYAEYGWTAGDTAPAPKLPDAHTVWTVADTAPLTPKHPVTLTWDNGQGLLFSRTISVDENYLFSVRDEVDNKGAMPVSLRPYALVTRHDEPHVDGVWVSHEGLVGVLQDQTLKEVTYKSLKSDGNQKFTGTSGWLGITSKYWAAALIPDQKAAYDANFRYFAEPRVSYQADYVLHPVAIAPGAKTTVEGHLFAGAKNVKLIDAYEAQLGAPLFNRLIDWGWFHVITRPMFYLIDWLYGIFGNFGLAMMATTVLVKLLFFPLANKSYASMSKMKKLQPEMQKIQERYKDDRVRQQQAIMELYKKEKVNPMSGCLPVFVQIPVFFALYKVLYVTLEMRQAPFFGWIRDLSAPDPTNIFNLFGLLPFTIPDSVPFLHLGVWPLVMGFTMWLQMKLNPPPPDPVQAKMFAWMPVMFTFMLGTFPAGLVIYWAWNNLLSILQQSYIMQRNGVEVKLWQNLKDDVAWLLPRGSGESSPKS